MLWSCAFSCWPGDTVYLYYLLNISSAGLAYQRLGIRAKQQFGIRRINLRDGERKKHFKLSSSFLEIFAALKFMFDGVLKTSASLLLSSLPVATCQWGKSEEAGGICAEAGGHEARWVFGSAAEGVRPRGVLVLIFVLCLMSDWQGQVNPSRDKVTNSFKD